MFIYDWQIDKLNVDGWINFYGSVILYYVWLKIKDIFTHKFVMKCKSSVDFTILSMRVAEKRLYDYERFRPYIAS